MKKSLSNKDNGEIDVNRQLSIHKYRKKQAANDAQLLMNRIALLQKEEERARKKVDTTKARALDILTMREENEHRMKDWMDAAEEDRKQREEIHARNFFLEEQSRMLKKDLANKQMAKKRESVDNLRGQKVVLRKELVQMKEQDVKRKQEMRTLVRQKEDEARKKREIAERKHEAEIRQYHEAKAEEEAQEAKRAEKLVKKLERKEKQWIDKLKTAQHVQENAFMDLENTLVRSPNTKNAQSHGDEGFDYDRNPQSSAPNSGRSGGRLSPLSGSGGDKKSKGKKKKAAAGSQQVYSS